MKLVNMENTWLQQAIENDLIALRSNLQNKDLTTY
jgi:hypothetical protein